MSDARFFPSVVLSLAFMIAVLGCAGDTQDQPAGSLSLQLTIGDDIYIDEVKWRITGGDMVPMDGSIDTSAPGATASIEVFGLPPTEDEEYTITLEAMATDGETTCKDSTNFEVDAGKVTEVMLMLRCKRPTTLGGVRVNGKLNVCAELTKVVVSPLRTSVGNEIDLFAQAVDVDSDVIEYEWTGGGGTIDDPNGDSTTYTCDEIGDHEVAITVSDDDSVYCTSGWTVPVSCVAGDGGTGGAGGEGGSGGAGGAFSKDFSAKIVRTKYGVPHVTADDWGSLGYGAGYAYAQDNFCVLMREIVVSNGQSARYLGDSNSNQNRDYIYTFFASDEYIENVFLPASNPKLQHLAIGYAAGFSRYLEDTGVENLPEGPEGCRDAEWVRPITDIDLGKVFRKLILRAGISQLTNLIMAADDSAPTQSLASLGRGLIKSEPIDSSALGLPEPTEMGSNAYGIGAQGSQSGSGLLLGNPHFPWQGPERWYVQHLTVPGEYDVMGASLQGVPLVNIGFNGDMAWSHTVSTAQRFGFYVLELVEDNPYQYHYDDEIRDIETNPVTIEVKLGDGTIEQRTKNIFMSHYGPILDLGAFSGLAGGWPTITGNAFAVRDANIDNTRILDQFAKMGQARSIDGLEDALKDIGLPWVNTIAADRGGTGYYADVSTVPNISQEKLDDCGNNLFGLALTNQGIATLDGSRSECEWGTDPDGPEGLLGFDNLPKIRTGTNVPYVSNSNDSYWLSSPNMLLENYSPLMGRNGFDPPERIEQSLRTRQGFVQAEERVAGTDGFGDPGFDIDNLRDIMFGSRNIAAELTLDDVIDACNGVADWSVGDCDGSPYSANPVVAAGACAILDDWDRLFNIDSVGAGLWNEVWRRMDRPETFWVVPFDPDDAVNTPRTVNMADPAVVEAIRCGIGAGVDVMVSRGIPLDRDWGEVQFRWNGDRSAQIPVHGGWGGFMWSVISANFVDGEGYSNIRAGNSYIQTVTWDGSECPDAYAVLTYSQSTDPTSPHYSDWTELMSGKGWNDMPYCPADIEADKISETMISTDD